MAAIGSGINPALGRIDYLPFLQGAQMAAQGRMQGSNALTEGVSQGFQDYLKKREQNAILEGKNNALLRDIAQDPQLSANPEIQKYTAKMAKGGPLTLNDQIKLNAELTTTVEAAKMRREEQRQKDYLALQQESARLNALRATREQAEYARKEGVQENLLRIALENPDAFKDPNKANQIVLSAGGNYEDAKRLFGDAVNRQQFDLDATSRHIELTERSIRLAEAVRNGEVTGKEPNLRVVEQNGVKMVYLLDALNRPVGQPQIIKDEKAEKGDIAQRYAYEYALAESKGDRPGMARALVNIRSTVKNAELRGDDEVVRDYVRPFVPNAGTAAPTEPLKVTGAPKPVSATPAPTAEAARVTQPQIPTAAAPSATPPQLGRTFVPMAGAAPFEAPAPVQPAPSAAPAPASPATQFPPVQDIVIDDGALSAYVSQMGKRLPTVDIDAASILSPELGARIQNINQYGGGSGALRNINLGGPPSARSQPVVPPSIDAETRAMSEAVRSRAESTLPFDRYRLPEPGALPQIKLSPAAQKIASELRRAASAGERGKAPEFFLEASTGDSGKRTRVKLGKNELFAILANNPMPNLSPTLEVDREETRRLMDQQMRMNELMRQYRPPASRAR